MAPVLIRSRNRNCHKGSYLLQRGLLLVVVVTFGTCLLQLLPSSNKDLLLFVEANAGFFTYYETPIKGVVGGIGPSRWPNLLVPGNQCGGMGQINGYGQSPIRIPKETRDKCDSDLSHYEFEGGTCTFDELLFRIVPNGVIVGPKLDVTCSLGRMKVPGKSNWFNALQFHIHTNSEHSVDGKYYANELHVVHQESNGESFAVFGTFIDSNPTNPDQDHNVFEDYLRGWEVAALQVEEFCSVTPEGTGIFNVNSAFKSRQMKVQCPAVGQGIDSSKVTVRPDTGMPLPKPVNFTSVPNRTNSIPSIYESLPTEGYGIYSYRGGLTTPPCTEIVNWNLLDTPMYISQRQINRLYKLILCFVEASTCRHATVASEFGYTNRPPQALNGRTIVHRCPANSNVLPVVTDAIAATSKQDVPPAPTVQAYQLTPLQIRGVLPHWGILYPWFVGAVGLVAYFLLTRYCHFFPYTALMFLVGICMGLGIALLPQQTDQLSVSTRMWENINSELLLLAFLPGLLFRDAYGLNVHLFQKALVQCLIMAFPMVLAGTAILALIGFYVLPYGWSFSLSMTFGAILSATDPVAVSALLNEVGAPPRLKTHISGESLLNDGSAIVFFTIFAGMFLFELGIPGLGRQVDAATGIALFFRMSLGAVAIGTAFGIGLVACLYLLNRRFSGEESIVQVSATICVAYLTYYTAESVCATSGVIGVVTCGIFTKSFGSNLINDPDMMEKFWALAEHLLNTVLFALGGVVWGTVISNGDPFRTEKFDIGDWGYLLILYILMTIVRFGLVFTFLPLIKRIGLKSNWQEAFFMSFGGLRGAVGIALAIALDNELNRDTIPGDPRRAYTSQLFGMTGGIAFMTLVINGTLAGPLLRKLGLADSTEMRHKIVERYRGHVEEHVLLTLLQMLGNSHFSSVDFGIIRSHVPFVRYITGDKLKTAIKQNKENTPVLKYVAPNLSSFQPYMSDEDYRELNKLSKVNMATKLKCMVKAASMQSGMNKLSSQRSMNGSSHGKSNRGLNDSSHDYNYDDNESQEEYIDQATLVELRKVFIELIRRAYDEQTARGHIDVREGLVVFALNSSLESALDRIAKGDALCDWEECLAVSTPVWAKAKEMKRRASSLTQRKTSATESFRTLASKVGATQKLAMDISRSCAFIQAHKMAQESFKEEFCNGRMLNVSERTILYESQAQIVAAELVFQTVPDACLARVIMSHLLSRTLLSNAAVIVGSYIQDGLLKEQEGEEYLEEIEKELKGIKHCHGQKDCRAQRKQKQRSSKNLEGGNDGSDDLDWNKDTSDDPSYFTLALSSSSQKNVENKSPQSNMHQVMHKIFKPDKVVEDVTPNETSSRKTVTGNEGGTLASSVIEPIEAVTTTEAAGTGIPVMTDSSSCSNSKDGDDGNNSVSSFVMAQEDMV